MNIFHDNIENLTINNKYFRQVIYTSPDRQMQLVLMTLKPEEDIGLEMHSHVNQFFRIDRGSGEAHIGKNPIEKIKLEDGSALIVPAGTWHNIINTSKDTELHLYTIYTPAQHKDGIIQKNKIETLQDGGFNESKEKYLKYKAKYLNLLQKLNKKY